MPAATASLEEVLAYRHEGVARRYAKEHGASLEEAREVFTEMVRFLYLCGQGTSQGQEVAVTPELLRLDWMWHCFILFTVDYAAFCEKYFGTFLHHVPAVEETEAEPEDPDAVRARLERQFGLVYDVLGEETLERWYGECRYA